MNNENMNNGPKRDCFAYRELLNGRGDCIALNELYCKNGGQCNFYKQHNKPLQEKYSDGHEDHFAPSSP